MNKMEPNYKSKADDPAKSCANCKNFEAESEGMGKCFGNDVSSEGTCDFFAPKE